MPYAVLIADDYAVVRQGVRSVLDQMPDVTVAAEVANGDDVVEAIRSPLRLDLALLDMSMPGLTGLDLIRLIKAERPALPVLVLTMHAAEQYAVRVLRAGASGYLTKDVVLDQLAVAVRTVLGGSRYVPPNVADLLLASLGLGDAPPHQRLSDREFEVFRLLVAGQPVNDIADRLALSVKTVSTYRTRILDKLGVSSTADLVRYAVQHGLT